MRSGFVSLTGRPNVGKSTLLNQIIGQKLAITSDKPQTTRNLIQGIYNDDDTQIVFVDTPGIHKPNHKLGQILNKGAYYSIDDVDVVCFLIDAKAGLGGGDKYIIERLKKVDKPVILVINKIDGLSKEEIFNKILEYKDLYNWSDIVPVSALKDKNTGTLIKVIKEYLPESVKFFDNDTVTNRSLEFMASEIVREKILRTTSEEIPYSVTCVTTKFVKDKGNRIINVDIIVDRDSLKKIIIGKQGQKLKKIGIEARKDLEQILDAKVYLELYVKTIEKWRDREKYLNEFKFTDFTE
ncbi:MAG TPA: GTPase Era [Candidatus Coprosoma intestinipullorum]|uniref:GTPase Era n=1 Tax=Candidatus Coprosoma intestinipullorum TaxID=2840752 RepID=A0A9D0ZPS7_9FIRM|nr:GTPase Era [Candidatus Coprosoma intestinipullorum]